MADHSLKPIDGDADLIELKEGELVVAGQRVDEKRQQAFRTYIEAGGNAEEAERRLKARGVNVSSTSIAKWKREPWWIQLYEEHVGDVYREFHVSLLAKADTFSKGLVEVVSGKDKTDKTANARVSAANLFTRLGTKPLQETTSKISVNQQFNTNVGNLNITKINQLSAEELLKWHSTGIEPDALSG